MVPNRENINSRSSSVVIEFNLQTNKTSTGGLASASGISPVISNTIARLFASFSLILFISSSSVRELSAVISKFSSNGIRALTVSFSGISLFKI